MKRGQKAQHIRQDKLNILFLSKGLVVSDFVKYSSTQEIIIPSTPFVSKLLEITTFTLLLHYVVQ